MGSQIRSGKENVKDALLDCGGWARKRERQMKRDREEVRKQRGRKRGLFSSFSVTVFLQENTEN